MGTAIICLDPSGSTLMRELGIVDYVPDLCFQYLYTPTSKSDSSKLLNKNYQTLADLQEYDRIELWVGPSLNDHISAFHLLTLFKEHEVIKRRLHVNHISEVAGMMNKQMMKAAQSQAIFPDIEIYNEAKAYWDAFRSPTPESWVTLLNDTPKHFPSFNLMRKMFALNMPLVPTNLRLVDIQILNHVKHNSRTAVHHLGHMLADNSVNKRTLTEEVIWEAIFSLANAPTPAISGLPLAPFEYFSTKTLDETRRKACFRATPSLTAFGETLLQKNGNWLDTNTHNYWWGGTHITQENMWSFDPVSLALTNHCHAS